ncbi:MAG: hemolysin family protein [Propionibacteriaceae bacterium]|nr:hemolysin family protein [Propionibacteriaceae bacterium]
MGSNIWVNIALVALFIIISAFFNAAELAMVSLRESQIKRLAAKGARGRKVAQLTSNPNRFLSTINLSSTFMGFLAASLGASTFAAELFPVLESLGMASGAAEIVALIFVTVVISYFSIVIADLTAKRLGMQRAESIALALAGFVNGVSVVAKPIVWFLGVSTDILMRFLGGDPKASKEVVTEEELRHMVTNAPTLTAEEREIVDEVFAAGERSLREVMVPRTEVEFLDGETPAYKATRELESASHSRFPVTGSSVDDILGFLHIRDLMYLDNAERATPIRQLVRPIMSMPDTVNVIHALTLMRHEGSHMAIVCDEYGGTAGIVTLEDLVEEFVGEIQDEYDVAVPPVISEADQVEVEGLTTLEQFEDLTGLILPEGPYDTVAGFWVAVRGVLPSQDDSITALVARQGSDQLTQIEMTVTQMDGRRASRIRICFTDLDVKGTS